MILKLPRQVHCVRLILVVVLACTLLAGCQRRGRFDDTTADVGASSSAMDQIGLVSHPAEINRLVSQLSPVDRHQLRQKRSRFYALDIAEKTRLRGFHEQVSQSESGTDLYAVLRQYRDWLATLPDGQRADLLELPPEQRIQKIREIRQTQQASSVRVHWGNISENDVMAIAKWLHEYVQSNEQALLNQLPDGTKSQIARMKPGRRRQRVLFVEVAKRADQIEFPRVNRAQGQKLRDSLSTEGLAQIGKLLNLDDSAPSVGRLLQKFAESIRGRMPSKERLMEFYKNELSSEQRDRIDQLPADEAQHEIRRLYVTRRLMDREGPERGRRGGGPPRQR